MDLSFGLQRKRQHTWVSPPTISQEESDDADMDIIFPSTKRSRLFCDCYALSPDVVIDNETLESDISMDISVKSTAEDGAEYAVEWWKRASVKQGQQKPPMLDDDDMVCHVCDSVYKKPTSIASTPFCNTFKPENSILSYFKCTSKTTAKRTKPSSVTIPEIAPTTSTSCTFCERQTCQNCLERCENCQKQFCRLCIRNDYLGNYSKILCLDCADGGFHEDTAMKV
ncbi:unnamed protein product [Cylindrotheca closterium]|uniref:Uncharacterized protein n=1 Tax=Cylindrotheca closterium TaxID=2856 RepID=A0AAD2FES9_9STRA|nr:unnamed protein product [Cylindrotheca closterium]